MEALNLISGVVGGSRPAPEAAAMRWIELASSAFTGALPSPRSGHTAVAVGGLVVVFGGLVDKVFLNDVAVLDTGTATWSRPDCGGGERAPCPRAFHVAVALDRNVFVFGGRSVGKARLGDFWMLDTETWQWADLTGLGQLPPARDFAAAVAMGKSRIILYGGWDGDKWLSDVHVLDAASLQWREVATEGPAPPARCGHTATIVERRLLVFGGRGGGGPIMGDLWVLKGVFEDEPEGATWVQLRLPGVAPAPRCGHSTTSFGTQVVVFGGHGTGGWISRYDVYFNDTSSLDRTTVQWAKVGIRGAASPPPRAYHTMTRVGRRLLLIGGFDGAATLGDLWWLVLEDDPLAKATKEAAAAAAVGTPGGAMAEGPPPAAAGPMAVGEDSEEDARYMEGLRGRIGLPPRPPPTARPPLEAGVDSPELVHLGLELGKDILGPSFLEVSPTTEEAVSLAREHLRAAAPGDLRLRDLTPLLSDYRLHVARRQGELGAACAPGRRHDFFHMRSADDIPLGKVAALQEEYRRLSAQGPSLQ